MQALPKAALLLATATKAPGRQDLLRHLAVWAPGNAAQGLQLLSGPAAADPPVQSYAIKCLFNERPEKVSALRRASCARFPTHSFWQRSCCTRCSRAIACTCGV